MDVFNEENGKGVAGKSIQAYSLEQWNNREDPQTE